MSERIEENKTYYQQHKERILQNQRKKYGKMTPEQKEEYRTYHREYWRIRHINVDTKPPKPTPRVRGIKENTSDVIPSFL